MDKAPDLVAKETDPLQFVRFCKYNVREAAERLVRYWEERREVFGDQAAFLPLTLTGHEALTRNDVLQLKAGFPAILPNASTGQQVVFCNRQQYLGSSDVQSRLRCCFYVASVLAPDDSAQTQGIIMLQLLVTPRVQGFSQAFVKKMCLLAAKAFPIKLQLHFLCCLPKDVTKRYAVQDVMTSFLTIVVDHMSIGDPHEMEVHFEREKGQILSELMDLGLIKEGIPTSLDGSWAFEQFAKWCHSRASLERKKDKSRASSRTNIAPPIGADSAFASSPSSWVALSPSTVAAISQLESQRASDMIQPSPSSIAAAALVASPEPAETTTEQEKESAKCNQVRASNAMHSRRKRDRRRREFNNLKEESSKLKAEHELLLSKNEYLASLLKRAEEVVVPVAAAEEEKEDNQEQNQKRQRRV
ncbi:hypothetical protein ACA910_011640 [Epithemia clementina (nom. ined.)]